jgi:negative regulator of sigma E activity
MQKAQIKEHAASCEECRAEYELFISMLDATRNLPPIKADDSFLAKLNARIDKEIVAAPVHKNVWEHIKLNAHRYSALAACVALVAVIGVNSTELINRLINPYQEDITPVVTLSPVVEKEEPADEVASSTIEPVQTEAPATTPIATPQPTPTQAPTPTPVQRAVAQPTPVSTPQPVVENVPSQLPANTDIAPASVSEDNSIATATPYTVVRSGYVLPEATDAAKGSGVEKATYSLESTSNYIKVSKADISRVIALVKQYSEDSDQGIYLMTEENIEQMLNAFAQEGIEFDNAIDTVADGNVAFKLIIS